MDPISLREKHMRAVVFAIVFTMGLSLLLSGCGEKPIGQPCNFGWPKSTGGTADCSAYPACHPLQNNSGQVSVNDNACPVDCIQMPSLECENLICVATQIEGDYQHMNGICWKPDPNEPGGGDCPDAQVRCKGYCTKECLTDASCPKEYRCSAMAPFGSTLRCDREEEWASSDPAKKCTNACDSYGETPDGTSVVCPSSDKNDGDDYNYENCSSPDYSTCCACICYQFCPILTKKFCRKRSWDDKMFEGAITKNTTCGQSD
jgi:hypothetical protein